MAKKLLGPWSVLYPVRFYSGGDTTRQAFGKHIQEITRIYGLLNALDAAKAGSEEIIEAITNMLHNNLKGLQGGNQNERYHLTLAQVTKLDNAPAGTDHNTNLTGLQGGSATERYHLTSAQVEKLNGAAAASDIITQHNDLSGIQGGEPGNYFHMRNDQVSAVMGLMAISDNTGFSYHNLLLGLQGGNDNERYHLTAAQVEKLNGAASSGDVIKIHNNLQGLQGGAENERYHLTARQLSDMQDLIDNPPEAPQVFEDESLSDSGFLKFSNGFILQWGKIRLSPSWVSEEDLLTQNFPVAFPTRCFNVVAGTSVLSGGDLNVDAMFQVANYSNASVSFMFQILDGHTAVTSGIDANYVAFGV